jgi:hypothetical protein
MTDTSTLIPTRHVLPPDAPPIRVGRTIDPEEAAAQAAVDRDVQDSWNEWKAAGRPVLFNKSPRSYYIVEPDRVDITVERLKNAARLYPGVRVRFTKPVSQIDADGMAWIFWVAKERLTRAEADAQRRALSEPQEPEEEKPEPRAAPVRRKAPATAQRRSTVSSPRFVAPRS